MIRKLRALNLFFGIFFILFWPLALKDSFLTFFLGFRKCPDGPVARRCVLNSGSEVADPRSKEHDYLHQRGSQSGLTKVRIFFIWNSLEKIPPYLGDIATVLFVVSVLVLFIMSVTYVPYCSGWMAVHNQRTPWGAVYPTLSGTFCTLVWVVPLFDTLSRSPKPDQTRCSSGGAQKLL